MLNITVDILVWAAAHPRGRSDTDRRRYLPDGCVCRMFLGVGGICMFL